MNKNIQMLEFIHNASKMANLPYQTHAEIEQAVKVLKDVLFIKEETKPETKSTE